METRKVKLGDVASFRKVSVKPQSGITYYCYSLPAFDNERTPEVLDGEEILSNKLLINDNDILVNKLNMRFKRIWNIDRLADNSVCSTEFLPMVVNDEVDRNFIYYVLLSDSFTRELSGMRTGTSGSHQRVKPEWILDYEFNLPPLTTQTQIAHILSAFDKKIAVNNRLNAKLEELLFAQFNNWIKGKNETWGLASDEVLGNLDIVVTDYVANGSFASLKENVQLLEGAGFAYFMRNTDLKTGTFNVYVPEHSYKFLSKSKLIGGEVIISNVGDVGSVYLCPKLDKPMTLGNNEIMVKGNLGEESLNNYLFLLFASGYGQHLIDSITGGSVQRKFNKTDFKSLKIPVPSQSGLKLFNSWSSPLFEQIELTNKESRHLAQLRDTLLPRLMDGTLKPKT